MLAVLARQLGDQGPYGNLQQELDRPLTVPPE